MTASLHKPIFETSYLNAQNVGRYRCIMRYFYDQHQRMRYWLKPLEVHGGATALGLLEEDYTLDQCQKDLNQLVEWGNLVPRHDGGRAATVEEYLRKKFRYQMTPYAVEIERLVAGLEKIRGYGGSLEPTLFEDIAGNLEQLEKAAGQFPPSQVLWGCYDTVPKLSVYEVYRPRDVDYVTLIPYYWNGIRRVLVDEELDDRMVEQTE